VSSETGRVLRASSRAVETECGLDARNSRLEGPRRFGKTSLLRAALAAAEHDGAVAIEVDFLGCVTAADVAQRIERAYGAQLDTRLRRWYDGLIRTLHPTLGAAPAGVGERTRPQTADRGLLDRLALRRRIQQRTGRRSVIAFDEFQEVVCIGAALPGAFRAEPGDARTRPEQLAWVASPRIDNAELRRSRYCPLAPIRPPRFGRVGGRRQRSRGLAD
jgi:hypothetical protein